MRPYIVLIFAALIFVATSSSQAAETLRDLQSIREVPPADANELRVDFEATVTYVDPIRAFIFVQDGEEAIFVYRPKIDNIEPGKVVRVQGCLSKGDMLPVIKDATVTALRDGELPAAVDVAAGKLTPEVDCRYLSIELEVLQTLVGAEQTLLFGKTLRGDSIYVQIKHLSGMIFANASRFAGNRIRCTGTLGLELRGGAFLEPGQDNSRIVAYKLFCNSPDNVEIIDEKAEPLRPAEVVGLPHLHDKNFPDGRFLTHAQISLIDYLPKPEMVVSNGSLGVRMAIEATMDIVPGTIVRIGGRKETRFDGRPSLRANYIRHLNLAEFQPPEPKTVADAIENFVVDQRITVEGRPLRVEKRKERPHLILEEDNKTIAVHFQDDAAQSLASVMPSIAHRVSVTGVSRPDDDGDSAFQIVVARTKDVQLVESRTPLSRVVVVGLAALLSLCGVAALWIKLLKAKVAQKTRQARDISLQLRSVYEGIDDGLLAFDRDWNTLAVNRAFCQTMGLDINVGDPVADLPERLKDCLRNVDDFQNKWHHWRLHPKSRSTLDLSLKGRNAEYVTIDSTPIRGDDDEPIGRILISRDETEKKALQAELLHSNKLEAVGRLVAGVAHDFNNVLTAITANLSIARLDKSKQVESVEEELSVAEDAAFRGAEIVRRLLTFSTKTQFKLQPHSINDIIERLSELTRHSFDASIRFEYDLDSSDPFVNVESTAIEQVLLNLYVNAKDAMPGGGVIEISTQAQRQLQTGQDVVSISVKDTGMGVSQEIRDRLFEPYFTTKDSDHGTGLGLSVSYRVVQQHSGVLRYHNRPNGGSEFQILLPLEESRDVADEAEIDGVHHGTDTVLIVDDEEAVRNVAQTILRRQGYVTITAGGGEEALEIVSKNDGIDLVLLDLTMPGMSGREVLKALRKHWPHIPVVLCSGYLVDEVSRLGDSDRADGVIAKPYNMSDLTSAVSKATHTRQRRSA